MTDPSPEPPSPPAASTAAAANAASAAAAAAVAAEHPPELAGPHHDEAPEQPPAAPFAPIYNLVTNQSTRTTHHPHVHYFFSDDDPDLLSQALAQQQEANMHDSATESAAPASRAVLLDLAPDAEGGYRVAAASSLSPAWAVLDAQLSRISPPASDGGSGSGSGGGPVGESPKKPDRLMLRIEGTEAGAAGSEGELLRLSDRSSAPGSGAASGSGSMQRDKGEGEDYAQLVDEFEKRMSMLRKVVEASEERRRNVALDGAAQSVSIQVTEEPADPPAPV